MKRDVLTGHALLKFLQSMNEEELKRQPVLIGIPIEDNPENEEHDYLCSHVSLNGPYIIIHTANARAPRWYWPFAFVKEAPPRSPEPKTDSMLNFWTGSSATSGDFVPDVSPVELRKTWTRMNNVQKMAQKIHPDTPGQPGMFSVEGGDDAQALWFRASMLALLCKGPLSERVKDDELDDAVFGLAAKFPMKKIEPGVPQQGLPFDVNEFLRQLKSGISSDSAPTLG